jgi:FolB domain
MRGKYSVKGMKFHAFHGALEVERELGQVFSVDVDLGIDLGAAEASEGAEPLVRGGDVYEVTKGVVMGSRFKSHVNLAMRIAGELLRRFESAADATVVVGRRQLFIPGEVDMILAEVHCTRDDLKAKA